MRYPKPYKRGRVYYFAHRDADGKRRIRSTGCERASDAHDEVRRFMDTHSTRSGGETFGTYSAPFFRPGLCPHEARLRDSGKSIGLQHMEGSRGWLDNWALTDAVFCAIPMREIRRGDILDLRKRLRVRVPSESRKIRGEGIPTVNKVIAAVKTVIAEAYFREDISANPADSVGDISYVERERDILTVDEVRRLSALPDSLALRVFKCAAWTGMRCGEVTGAGVEQLSDGLLRIDHAWKHCKAEHTGEPKWGKVREIALAPTIRTDLERWCAGRTGLVFTREDGQRIRADFWREQFKVILAAAGIERGERRLTPHSLRHTLNTHLLEAGVDPLRIQLYLWGKSGAAVEQGMTSRITSIQAGYTHFRAAMTEPVALAIERLYGATGEARAQGAG